MTTKTLRVADFHRNVQDLARGAIYGKSLGDPRVMAVRAEADDNGNAEMFIYDVIDDWFGVSASWVAAALRRLEADHDSVTVRVNSPGGMVFEGAAIYSALQSSPLKVHVQVDGLAASAAAILSMAADKVTMTAMSMMMIHEAWGVAIGDEAEMRASAELLRKLNGQQADVFAARSQKPREEVLELLAAETWMTADEAIEQGFADAKIAPKTKAAPVESDDGVQARMLARYRHAAKASQRVAAAPDVGAMPIAARAAQGTLRAALRL